VRDLTCVEVNDSAPGFALDILEPNVRARVAAHLIRCPGCRVTVTDMQDSADRLLDLGDHGPGHDEPLWPAWQEWPDEPDWPAARPARRRLRMVVTIAAAALLIVGTTIGPELEQAASTPEKPVATAVLIAGSQPVGAVHVYGGRVPAVDVQLQGLPESGRLDVVLVSRDGTARRIGTVRVSDGRSSWVGPDPVARAELTGVVLVDAARHEVAAASVP
jgi:hypothetical protein